MDYEKLLNDRQLEAVERTKGPVLILAGAGSGKTRVLTYRTSYLIERENVAPYHIMAITFTNKAAAEMKNRISTVVGDRGQDVWVSTFHSSCVRILRRFAAEAGYDRNFSIYDADDSKTVMKAVMKKLNVDPKKFKERTFLSAISKAKDELKGPEEALKDWGHDPVAMLKYKTYKEYQDRLKESNALDFDDLIVKTVELLQTNSEVLSYYQKKFEYMMVDEYQDTNTAQFELVRLLSGGTRNLCVVGDDDQSIYKFRGANIKNILNFEHYFPDATVIRLEQNYRSTKTILSAANSVIKNNEARKDKTLWTENEEGEKIKVCSFESAYEEADYIATDVASRKRKANDSYSDYAVLYRTNAQSRILEEKFIRENIPYKIVGGVNFYSRKEIKDVIAYLKAIVNPSDDLSVRRIINVPKRGIGEASVEKAAVFATANGTSLYEGLLSSDINPAIKSAASKIRSFTSLIEGFKSRLNEPVPTIIRAVLEESGYQNELVIENTDDSKARLENLEEFINKAVVYQNDNEEPTLSGFLEEVALIADIDNLPEGDDYVLLMTLHGAKGLEFDTVYIAGMEDGLFPGFMAITASDGGEELAEERRLFYVGITRARKNLTLTLARTRMIRGEYQTSSPSRFLKEISPLLTESNMPTVSFSPKKEEAFEKKIRRSFSPDNSYNPFKKPVAPKNFGTTIVKAPLSYEVGDRVRHRKFGEGVVLSITDGGRDFEVTVRFEDGEEKKMFASFAKLEKA